MATVTTQQEIIELSARTWRQMSERDADALAEGVHDDAVFVHMGATMTKDQELEVIRRGDIQYKTVDVESVTVPLLSDHTAVLLTTLRLVAVVGGEEVTNPFVTTEVYVRTDERWQLASLSFTRLLTP
nr:nuclear transport factor 2 family protein [Propioniciclava soli]